MKFYEVSLKPPVFAYRMLGDKGIKDPQKMIRPWKRVGKRIDKIFQFFLWGGETSVTCGDIWKILQPPKVAMELAN